MGKNGLLGELEQLILLAVVALAPENAYAVGIHRELERQTGLTFSLGSIYVTLDRLHRKGLLESAKAEPQPRRGGKARRLFSITDNGDQMLQLSRQAFQRMWELAESCGEEA